MKGRHLFGKTYLWLQECGAVLTSLHEVIKLFYFVFLQLKPVYYINIWDVNLVKVQKVIQFSYHVMAPIIRKCPTFFSQTPGKVCTPIKIINEWTRGIHVRRATVEMSYLMNGFFSTVFLIKFVFIATTNYFLVTISSLSQYVQNRREALTKKQVLCFQRKKSKNIRTANFISLN